MELRTTRGWVGNSVLLSGTGIMVAETALESKMDGGKSIDRKEL